MKERTNREAVEYSVQEEIVGRKMIDWIAVGSTTPWLVRVFHQTPGCARGYGHSTPSGLLGDFCWEIRAENLLLARKPEGLQCQ
jgi:hypothetical protein